ncbi:4Fe-4S dicluster domain-containing protein [Candidatus Omnitrophota bacterium]
MDHYYLKQEDLNKFLESLKTTHNLFVPQKAEDDFILTSYSEIAPEDVVFNTYRTVEPIKSFLTHSKEDIGECFSDQEPQIGDKKTVVFGVKNCDLFSLKIQDYVFLEGDVVDPYYQARRDNTILISSDCTAYKETCFCLSLDIAPYPTEGADINLSPINDGFLVDVHSDKGKELIEAYAMYFTPASSGQVAGCKMKRDSFVEEFSKVLAQKDIPKKEHLQDAVKKGCDSDIWQEKMLTCVECGGCNFICSTCHCFLLVDEGADQRPRRVRVWDACLYANFARVAGGANPMKLRKQRLRNRFMKKFDFFPDNLGIHACTGCGRCIEVCPAKIDIREVLKELYTQSQKV